MVERCIHGIEKHGCAYCNGVIDEKQNRAKSNDKELSTLKEKYSQVKAKFKTFRDLWTEDEINVVYERLKNASKTELKKTYYKVALELERSRLAVEWTYCHIFSDRLNLHRGKTVLKFRNQMLNSNI